LETVVSLGEFNLLRRPIGGTFACSFHKIHFCFGGPTHTRSASSGKWRLGLCRHPLFEQPLQIPTLLACTQAHGVRRWVSSTLSQKVGVFDSFVVLVFVFDWVYNSDLARVWSSRRRKGRPAAPSRMMEVVSPDKEMDSLTVRISRSTHAELRALAEETDESMTEILDKAIDLYRRKRFLDGLNADFAALRQNKAAWEEELAERDSWDATLADGLED
jgi:predicted transcriptional regulator